MPRTKRTARLPKAFFSRQVIGFDDIFPASTLAQLLAVVESNPNNAGEGSGSSSPPSTASEPDEPSSKRRKIDEPEDNSVKISRSEVSFSRRLSDRSPERYTKAREDVGSQLNFGLREGRLLITSRPSSPLGLISSAVSIKREDLDRNTELILQAAEKQTRQLAPGALWAKVDLAVTRIDGKVTMAVGLELHWNQTISPYQSLRLKKDRKGTQRVLDALFPRTSSPRAASAWSPMDFYDAAYAPPKDDSSAQKIDVPRLGSTLFPYQKRTLQWLLNREGVRWSASTGTVEPIPEDSPLPDLAAFRRIEDADGQEAYVSDVFHTITRDTLPFQRADRAVRGGILAEEMGLGKTLEILGLITLNQRHDFPEPVGEGQDPPLLPTGATLIVTPESLRQQWLAEITRHAPSLRVKHYQGCKKVTDEEEEDLMVAELAGFDIVITTYSVLSAELHFTEEPPERSRRYERAYRRTKSPLVRISWWRLCLDEAQMIENGFSKAATVARVLPRINAWGITGTPVKDDVRDLYGLLLFLRYHPYSISHIWDALLIDKPLFQRLFKSVALRHTKTMVRDELSIPPQKRFVISMPFTAIEEQHYQSLFKEMADACGVDVDGAPIVPEWDPEDYEENMRVWLNRLRQAILHPEVGVYNRRVLGQSKSRPMRTIEEVLDAMLEQSENAIRTDERAYLMSKLTRGQLYENSPRVKEALTIWEEVRNETTQIVKEARSKFETCLREQLGEEALQKTQIDDVSDSEDDLDEAETKGRIGEHRRRLRTALELHHRAVFFCSNAYFQIRDNPEMTEPESEDFDKLKKMEDDGYEQAKQLRREILRPVQKKTGRLMNKIANKASGQSFTEVPELVVKSEKGIESGRVVDGLEILYGELNNQANVLDDWRELVIQLLLRSLVDEEDNVETTGEELGDSAKIQDELMAYVTALRAVIADRQEAISGQPSELIKHETETAIKMAKEGDGPAPEKLLQLMEIRTQVKPKMAQMTMRGVIGEFRGIMSRLVRDTHSSARETVERKIVSDQLKATQAQLNEQNKAALALESEIEAFKTAMNARLDYYRQLQAVSDGVLPYEGPKTEHVIERLSKTEQDLKSRLSSAESKHRYLMNLKEAGSKSNEPRMCVICQTTFVTGILTVCGHQFCKECMSMWFKSHHNCPVCKRALKQSNLHDITIKPQQLQLHNDTTMHTNQNQPQSPSQTRSDNTKNRMIYSEFNSDKLAEIKDIELEGPSFTTKVDTLVRHLLWLRENDPGSKSIIFSQYKDFLYVLRNAFNRFRIGYASIDDHNGISKFKNDPAVECFLLHARAHSSGLNLVNASHVFLCEPLLNTALELQAIARVDRIGQQHETTVWLYLVSGTVEESIHNLSVQRRMEHMGRNVKGKSKESTPELLDVNIEAANTLELEHAALSKLMSKDRNAGEAVAQGDLWECLFGHVANKPAESEKDSRFQEQAVMSYLAGEAAEARRGS